MTFARTVMLAIAMAGLAACGASGPEVRALSDPQANFSQYRSFAFASPLGTDRGGYKSLVSEALKAAVRRELTARGLTESATPDLVVNFNARLDDKTKVSTTPMPVTGPMMMGPGYYGYRRGLYQPWPMYVDQTTVTNYKQGTLNIDVADAARKQLVWEGVVIGKVTARQESNIDAAIADAVRAAFTKFPVPPRAP